MIRSIAVATPSAKVDRHESNEGDGILTAHPGNGLERMFGLRGQSALVVDNNGNAGIDAAVALAQAGATVLFADRDGGRVDAAVAAVRDAGGEAIGHIADVEREDDVKALFARVDADLPRLDIFVSACGLTTNAPLATMSAAFWDEAQSSNLRCVFFCAREAVNRMGDGGRIVIISTIGALHPVLHDNSAYGAARAGALALTRTIAFDYSAKGVRANCILPGAFIGKVANHPDTSARLERGDWPKGPGTEDTRRPFGFGDAADIGAAVVYLAGPSAGFVSGQALALDGGFFVH